MTSCYLPMWQRVKSGAHGHHHVYDTNDGTVRSSSCAKAPSSSSQRRPFLSSCRDARGVTLTRGLGDFPARVDLRIRHDHPRLGLRDVALQRQHHEQCGDQGVLTLGLPNGLNRTLRRVFRQPVTAASPAGLPMDGPPFPMDGPPFPMDTANGVWAPGPPASIAPCPPAKLHPRMNPALESGPLISRELSVESTRRYTMPESSLLLSSSATPPSGLSSSELSMGDGDSLGSNPLCLQTYVNLGQLSDNESSKSGLQRLKHVDQGYESLRHEAAVISTSVDVQSFELVSNKSRVDDVRATDIPIGKLHMLTRNAKRIPLTSNTDEAELKAVKSTANRITDLPTAILVRILSFLQDSAALTRVSSTCRRLYSLVWSSKVLWTSILLYNESSLDVDLALKTILRLTQGSSETLILSNCVKLTDRGLAIVARKCGDRLRRIDIQHCVNVTNGGLMELLTKCNNIEHLDLTGCTLLTTVTAHPSFSTTGGQLSRSCLPLTKKQLKLVYVDISDCVNIEDAGLCRMLEVCPKLSQLYARRCLRITDACVRHLSLYCRSVRELSLSECPLLSSASLLELSRLGPSLRYLSISKCPLMSDEGLKHLARHCYKLRYLNIRGCELVSDDGLMALSRSCSRLRALDVGKCDITDLGLRTLSQHCPNLKRLGLRACEIISDEGVRSVAFYCRGLRHLNVLECQDVSEQSVREVRQLCGKCTIEHSKPGIH